MISEWRHVYRRFHNFVEGLRPTLSEANIANGAAVEVALCLKRHFRPSGSADLDYLIIGGYGKGTAVRPARTVDLIYDLPIECRRADSASDSGPLILLDVAAILGERFSAVEPGKGWLMVVPAGTDVAVRVIPAFSCADGGYLTVDSAVNAGNGHWRQINPMAEVTALREADDRSARKATHLILMMKAWRRQRSVPIGAFPIELLVTEFVAVWNYHRRSLLFYDWMIRDLFFWLRHQMGRSMMIPGTVDRLVIGADWIAEAENGYLAATHACLLERDNDAAGAIAMWRQIFGSIFDDSGQTAGEDSTILPKPGNKIESAA